MASRTPGPEREGLAVLVAGVCGVVDNAGADHPAAASRGPEPKTGKVQEGPLSALVSGAGTLTYRAPPDGSPYVVVNRADGVYTHLPEPGDKVGCGGVLYRVDHRPVLLLCGAVPVYRALHVGLRGPDVRQLNRNLRDIGYAPDARRDRAFSPRTERALRVLQRRPAFA